ncbi:unnamed protein product [Owenia fusiformis]|uniref:Uncharacterized protein n=1 Tax=Owenia fusiformis TaxID=6347 RepID=A0A8J1USM1_OWEFU|nr:unnamed protein product [Owenia fusiformis]
MAGIHKFASLDECEKYLDIYKQKYLDIYKQNTLSRWTNVHTRSKFGLTAPEFLSGVKMTTQVQWRKQAEDGIKIPFDGVPFFILGKKQYACHRGKDKDKPQKEKRKLANDAKCDKDHTFSRLRKKTLVQDTKKVNCPAQIFIDRVLRFPQYKARSSSEGDKKIASRALRLGLTTKDSKAAAGAEEVFLMKIPDNGSHRGHVTDIGSVEVIQRSWKMSTRSFLHVVKKINNVDQGLIDRCTRFMVGDKQIGIILPDSLATLEKYVDTFDKTLNDKNQMCLYLKSKYDTFESRSEQLATVLTDLRARDVFSCLKGWRNECYNAFDRFCDPPLFKVERSASGLLGIKASGVHINGYVKTIDGIKLWIARRSLTKPTYPGLLDNIIAGGIEAGRGFLETARKESQEEASVPDELLGNLKPAGCVSYWYMDDRGILPETEYVMDIELPSEFQPVNSDGEVLEFYLWSIDKVQEMLYLHLDQFKPNVAVVMLDFLIRHGYVHPDNEPNYAQIVQGIHRTHF